MGVFCLRIFGNHLLRFVKKGALFVVLVHKHGRLCFRHEFRSEECRLFAKFLERIDVLTFILRQIILKINGHMLKSKILTWIQTVCSKIYRSAERQKLTDWW